MTYALNRRTIDVDCHVIGFADFLANAANPEDRALLMELSPWASEATT